MYIRRSYLTLDVTRPCGNKFIWLVIQDHTLPLSVPKWLKWFSDNQNIRNKGQVRVVARRWGTLHRTQGRWTSKPVGLANYTLGRAGTLLPPLNICRPAKHSCQETMYVCILVVRLTCCVHQLIGSKLWLKLSTRYRRFLSLKYANLIELMVNHRTAETKKLFSIVIVLFCLFRENYVSLIIINLISI